MDFSPLINDVTQNFMPFLLACGPTGWGSLLCGEQFHSNIANMSRHEPTGTHQPPSSSSALRLARVEKKKKDRKMKTSTRALHPALSPSAAFNPLVPLWACHSERSVFGPSSSALRDCVAPKLQVSGECGWVWAHFLGNTTDWKTERCYRWFSCRRRKTLREAFPPVATLANVVCSCWPDSLPMTLSHSVERNQGEVVFEAVGWLINQSINTSTRKDRSARFGPDWLDHVTHSDNLWSTLWSRSSDVAVVTPWLGEQHAKGMSALWRPTMKPSGCKTVVLTFFFFHSNQHVKNRVYCCSKICITAPIFFWHTTLYVWLDLLISLATKEAAWRLFSASGCVFLCHFEINRHLVLLPLLQYNLDRLQQRPLWPWLQVTTAVEHDWLNKSSLICYKGRHWLWGLSRFPDDTPGNSISFC